MSSILGAAIGSRAIRVNFMVEENYTILARFNRAADAQAARDLVSCLLHTAAHYDTHDRSPYREVLQPDMQVTKTHGEARWDAYDAPLPIRVFAHERGISWPGGPAFHSYDIGGQLTVEAYGRCLLVDYCSTNPIGWRSLELFLQDTLRASIQRFYFGDPLELKLTATGGDEMPTTVLRSYCNALRAAQSHYVEHGSAPRRSWHWGTVSPRCHPEVPSP